MSSKKESEKQFLIQLIEVYRNLPALWQIKSDDYHNRNKKIECYKVLFSKYQEFYKDQSMEDLKKKINALRTNFRNELRKIEKSARSGAGTDEVYESTAWFMAPMQFLRDQETPARSISTMEEQIDTSTEQDTIVSKFSYMIILFSYSLDKCRMSRKA